MPREGFNDWVGRIYGARRNEGLTRKRGAWAATDDRDVGRAVDSLGDRLG